MQVKDENISLRTIVSFFEIIDNQFFVLMDFIGTSCISFFQLTTNKVINCMFNFETQKTSKN